MTIAHEPKGFVSLKGKRFGYWKVGKRIVRKGTDGAIYECTCDCGTVSEVEADCLRRGTSASCGCSRLRQFCPKGHDTHVIGRTSDGTCRRCIRGKRIQKLYGISLDEYEGLWVFQRGKCAICETSLQPFSEVGASGWGNGVRIEVDHDHNPNLKPRDAVRGLLCGGRWKGCNRKLGNMDKLPWLRKVIAYLENPPAQQFIKEQDDRSTGSPGILPTRGRNDADEGAVAVCELRQADLQPRPKRTASAGSASPEVRRTGPQGSMQRLLQHEDHAR